VVNAASSKLAAPPFMFPPLIHDLRGRVTFVIIAHQGALLADVDRLVALFHGEVLFEGRPDDVATTEGNIAASYPHHAFMQTLALLDGSKVRQ